MTAILLQRSAQPYTCMCCGRLAIGLGVYEPRKPLIAWVCDDRACAAATRVLIDMKANELVACELRACEAAAEKVTEAVVNEVMGAMWDAGVRDLSAATPDQVTKALASLARPMTAHVGAALIAFGGSVKSQLQNGECPF